MLAGIITSACCVFMHPYVLVFSEAAVPAVNIVHDIIKAQKDVGSPATTLTSSKDYTGYICNLKNKYYENSIILVPLSRNIIECVDLEVMGKVEAVVVYFDSKNKISGKNIKAYSDFLKSHNLYNGLVIFDNDKDDSDAYCDEIRNICGSLFNIVLLNKFDGDQDANIDNEYGYKAVLQALYCTNWSNINIEKDFHSSTSVPSWNFRHSNGSDADIDSFENLLLNIQAFKSISKTLQRDEVLAFAENVATHLAELTNSDFDDDV